MTPSSLLFLLWQKKNNPTVEDQIDHFKEILWSSIQSFLNTIAQALPTIIGALLLLILGWIFAKVISYIIKKVLTISKFDELADRINAGEILGKANINSKPSQLISRFVYWVIILFSFVMASDFLKLDIVSKQIGNLISFLPTVLSALILLIVGFFIASFVRDIVAAATTSLGMTGGKFVSNIVFYFIIIMVVIMVMDQLGIQTEIITYQVLLFIGAILLAGSISYGIASRKILSSMLAAYFSRHTYEVGQVIRIDDIEGQIIKITKVFLVLQTADDKVVIPTKELLDTRVHIIRG